MSPKTDVLRGTLDLLILQSLSTGRNHGLGIARRIQQLTGGTFEVSAGSALPGASPAGRARLARRPVERLGEQPPGQVLRADAGRPPATQERDGRMAARVGRHGTRARPGLSGPAATEADMWFRCAHRADDARRHPGMRGPHPSGVARQRHQRSENGLTTELTRVDVQRRPTGLPAHPLAGLKACVTPSFAS